MKHVLKRVSIRYWIFAATAFVVLLMIIAILAYSRYQGREQAKYSFEKVFDQTVSNLQNTVFSTITLSDLIVLNETVRGIMDKPASVYESDIPQANDDITALRNILITSAFNRNITKVRLISDQGLALVKDGDVVSLVSPDIISLWNGKVAQFGFSYFWTDMKEVTGAADPQNISMVRAISRMDHFYDYKSYVEVDIPQTVFKSILETGEYTYDTQLFILDENNEMVLAPSEEEGYYNDYMKAPLQEDGVASMKIAGNRCIVGARAVENTNWRIVMVMPYASAGNISGLPRWEMLTILLSVIAVILLIAYAISYLITRRLRNMVSRVSHEVTAGHFDARIEGSAMYEVDSLSSSFNEMLSQIDGLMKEQYRLGRQIKNLELKSLQSQINPHFLYNTLDLINWMAIRDNNINVSNAVKEMAKFYKTSLSNGKDIVTVGNELEHVAAYVNIQNMRYENAVSLTIEVPEQFKAYELPKITLQPILENAILHGILKREDERGKIVISAGEEDDGFLALCVWDNGVGMYDEELGRVPELEDLKKKSTGSYGLANIDERLKLYFGPECGLRFESVKGEYTRVYIRFAKMGHNGR